jgi:hypothetical protein
MRLRFLAPTAVLSLVAALVPASDARACGGCFGPPVIQQSGSTVVTGHRMALTTSPTQSVLWDQIQYSGDPKEFAWVLPVHHGAVLEESTDAWFETLEAATVAQVTSPQIVCPSVTSPQGCAGSSFSAFADGTSGAGGGSGGGAPPVTVLHEGTVGPYETVTLATNTPGALNAWLTMHGYNIDADIQPVVDAYVAEDFDFIALRLLPNKGIRTMKPVRVVTPGAAMTLPLRMVAAGTGSNVAITLYTITEGRLEADQYGNLTFPQDQLVWDFKAQSSNYAALRTTLLKKDAGRTWLTAYASQGALLSNNYGGYYNGAGDYYGGSIASTYAYQGQSNGETTDISACTTAFDQIADSTDLVVDPCPPGVMPGDPSCGQIAPGQIDATTLACGALDDMAVALTGLHPRDVWLTRLEANLPRAALAKDLSLTPSASQSEVSNYMQANQGINEDGLCPAQVPPLSMIAPGYGKAAGSGRGVDRRSAFGYAVMGLLLAGAVVRRRRRR